MPRRARARLAPNVHIGDHAPTARASRARLRARRRRPRCHRRAAAPGVRLGDRQPARRDRMPRADHRGGAARGARPVRHRAGDHAVARRGRADRRRGVLTAVRPRARPRRHGAAARRPRQRSQGHRSAVVARPDPGPRQPADPGRALPPLGGRGRRRRHHRRARELPDLHRHPRQRGARRARRRGHGRSRRPDAAPGVRLGRRRGVAAAAGVLREDGGGDARSRGRPHTHRTADGTRSPPCSAGSIWSATTTTSRATAQGIAPARPLLGRERSDDPPQLRAGDQARPICSPPRSPRARPRRQRSSSSTPSPRAISPTSPAAHSTTSGAPRPRPT